MFLLCWIGYHRKLEWGHNLETDRTEPRCRRCGKFVNADETPWLKDKRFR